MQISYTYLVQHRTIFTEEIQVAGHNKDTSHQSAKCFLTEILHILQILTLIKLSRT